MPGRSASEFSLLQRRLEDAERAAQLAETTIQEMRNIVYDLLCIVGSAETCPKCGIKGFWIRPRGGGAAIIYNPDGTQHWPRCPKTARPELTMEGIA